MSRQMRLYSPNKIYICFIMAGEMSNYLVGMILAIAPFFERFFVGRVISLTLGLSLRQ